MTPPPPKPFQGHIAASAHKKQGSRFDNFHIFTPKNSIPKISPENAEIILDKMANPVYNDKADFRQRKYMAA